MSKLIVKDLCCQRGYNQLFSDLSFEVSSSNILRITGPNGSGKTSLLKILAGLNASENGTVYLNDFNVNSYEYQQHVFYLGHSQALSSELSVIENLEFLMSLKDTVGRKILTESLVKIGLQGYKDEYCSKLSAGQKRRVILAGLFISNAKVWLLDEPFTALDNEGIRIVEKLIKEHCDAGGICLFTTHQDSTLDNQMVLAL
ncbi:MAG TPA: cytochrome c biogenesis heme-transporting ATPase CcmA [Candidatus Thioglobus sp.]|jgi:heme exporter protein A|nr:cytochrome c biogenesis heme-transporting ATPase CcmA [Candidatus Thioglobus sp.]HIK77468.1 cytochrome c biogenesis heme-transporting ATPase CcmA [Gammaproteobacteria bacterium]